MPLLHKKSFVRKRAPAGVSTNDKVFYCELTNEAFSDYDEYWERLVLCNAMVWTCELTGRPNLTYQEALDCEAKGAKFVSSIAPSLKLTMLYLASLTRRGRQSDLSEDVFMHCRDRYFPGEPVEAIVNNHWYDSKVIRVISPNRDEVAAYEKEMAESDDEAVVSGGEDPLSLPQDGSFSKPITLDDDNASSDSDIQVIEPTKPSTPRKPSTPLKEDLNDPPYATYKYEVEEELAWDYKTCKRHTVTWEQIRRSKNAITREKCRLFLKINTELSPQGYWRVKDSVAHKYSVAKAKYADFFPGRAPQFAESKSKKLPLSLSPRGKEVHDRLQKKEGKLRDKKEAREEKRLSKGTTDESKKKGRQTISGQEKLARKLERIKSKQLELVPASTMVAPAVVAAPLDPAEAAARAKEQQRLMQKRQDHFAHIKEILKQKMEKEKLEKKQERDVKKEERKLLAQEIKDWHKPREDLQCGHHKALPIPASVECGVPNHQFGDFLSLLEFLNSFSEVLELTDVYPHGISFEMLENALVTKEVAGVFNDVVQLLLGAVFNLQEEEEEEITADTTVDPTVGLSLDGSGNDQRASAVVLANRASQWASQHHSTSLHQLPLDALTLTEVLRLHLLAAGAENNANAQWRHMNRGGYKHWDDPGMQMKLEHPEVVRTLSVKSIFDVSIEMKLQVLQALMQQILTYASVRDRLEEAFDKIREAKAALKEVQVSYNKVEREEHQARVLKKKEIRLKNSNLLLKKKQQQGADATATGSAADAAATGAAAAAGPDAVPEPATPEEEHQSEDEEQKKEREDKLEKSREKRKQEQSKKEVELCEQILELSAKVNHLSLGMDRSYRRYWLFRSVSGVFIEDDEAFPGTCFDVPTAQVPDVQPEECSTTLARLQMQAQQIVNPDAAVKEEQQGKDIEEKANTSDKENDTNTPNKINGAFDDTHLKSSTLSPNAISDTVNNVISSPVKNSLLLLQAPTAGKKLLKASNVAVNGASKIIPKSVKDQSITKFFSKSPKCVNGTANGEAEPVVVIQSPSKNTDANVKTGDEATDSKREEDVKAEAVVEAEVLGLCTAEPETCPVHTINSTRPKWSFLYKEEDIKALVQTLNDRGDRESTLKENLNLYSAKIENSVKNCPVYILNPTEDFDQESYVRKSRRTGGKKGGDSDTNLNFPLGTPIDNILELTLRDMILEVEEKLYVGVLGRLQVPDRELWRTAITKDSAASQPHKLNWAGQNRIASFKREIGLEAASEDSSSRSRQQEGSTVSLLAAALLQVAQSVDNKYIRPPLAETDKVKQRRLKAERKLRRLVEKREKEKEEQLQGAAVNSDDSDSESEAGDSNPLHTVSDNSLRTPMERWEASLETATSYSQVFLHLATLDNSVTWSRSLTKTRCRVCRKGGDHEKMLLCDGCDKGHHIFCLKPKIKSIPDGDWFCDKCKPKLKAKSPKKNRIIYVEEEEEEEHEEEEEQQEVEEEEEEEEEEETEQAEEEGYENDFCVECNTGGSLICCDNCPGSYHLQCVGIKKVPRGNWNCPRCSTAQQQEKEKAKKGKGSSEDRSPKASDERTSKKSEGSSSKVATGSSKRSAAGAAVESKGKKRKGAPEEVPEMRASKRRAVDETESVASSNGRASKRSRTEQTLDELLHPSLLHKLLVELQGHEEAWPFLTPVNKKTVPDYYQLIKKPMDLQTMREKLNSVRYSSDAAFIADGLLVFQNCQQYNMEDTQEYKSGVKLAKLFRKRAIELGVKIEPDLELSNGRSSKQAKGAKKTAPAKRKRQSL